MSNRKQADRIIFETTKHHKQILRQQIDPTLIDRIQIDRNPSQNYMNAYKSLYNDQLEKTVQLHQEKKQKKQQLQNYDKFLFTVAMKQERPPMIDQTNMSSSQLSKYGQRYVDYDEEKTLKYQDHVVKNYDGGQAFYKAHDQHLQKKRAESQVTNQTLNNQMQFKEFMKKKQQENKSQQNQAFKELKYHQRLQDQDQFQKEKQEKTAFRQEIVKQIQQEHQKRQRKSIFEYQNVARHNPITNPIEYHIDNPYILKEIQNRDSLKSVSMYQNSRY